MPKKKKNSSSSEAKNTDLLVDLKGIGLVLIALIGCLPFGIVAEIIRGFGQCNGGDIRSRDFYQRSSEEITEAYSEGSHRKTCNILI